MRLKNQAYILTEKIQNRMPGDFISKDGDFFITNYEFVSQDGLGIVCIELMFDSLFDHLNLWYIEGEDIVSIGLTHAQQIKEAKNYLYKI